MQAALEILQSFGIRPSHQRLKVLGYLLEHRTHPSADEIYEGLHDSMPLISRTTVFNTLRLFQESGVVQAISIGTNAIAYDADIAPHAHLYCRKCHSLTDIPVEISDWQILQCYGGASATGMQVTFHGTCASCSGIESDR